MGAARVIIRYHEIVLKRGNRRRFVSQLAENVRRMLRGTSIRKMYLGPSRIIVPLPRGEEWPEVRERLQHVFGVANFLLCYRGDRSLEGLTRRIVRALEGRTIRSFAIRCKRTDKTFPVISPEVCRAVGKAVQDATRAAVDLDEPETEIHIEILPREVFFSLEKVEGPGGLPLGSSGSVVVLLSGGIDSPVAAFRMMQRGCQVDLVHFHGAPYQGPSSREKVAEIAEVLNRWQPDLRLHLLPFGNVQREIVNSARAPFRVILYRRMMVRIAEAIAKRVGASALVSGESLGQVASQTLPNMTVVEDAATLPVLRPLIGMDKLEITQQAQRLGTYPISIEPDEDCCQLFVPRRPATRMTVEEAQAAERSLDVSGLVASALEQASTIELCFPRERLRQVENAIARRHEVEP
jgi:thiamine biosynthesis protein ThiI